jgi:hypothetical protein
MHKLVPVVERWGAFPELKKNPQRVESHQDER